MYYRVRIKRSGDWPFVIIVKAESVKEVVEKVEKHYPMHSIEDVSESGVTDVI